MSTFIDESVATELAPPRAFDQACRMVVGYLSQEFPMGAWAVTRVASERQTVLVAADSGFGLAPGVGGRWTSSVCRRMITGDVPRVVPDAHVRPELSEALCAAEEQGMELGSYVGTPILYGDGDLFGTLIGLDARPADDGPSVDEPLLDLLSSLLSAVLEADSSAVEHARVLERAVTEAETDALTGLLNRRGWDRWLAREEDRFRRFGDPACVLMIDLDGLKVVNDTQGHGAGDRYLQRTAELLRAATRQGDVLARLGGDEFVMVATVGPEDVGPLASRLQRVLDGAGTPCSVGVAPVGVSAGFSAAVAEADEAMYSDKRARR